MGASSSVLGYTLSSACEAHSHDGPHESGQPHAEVIKAKCPTTRWTAKAPEDGFAVMGEESTPRMDLLSHRLSNQLHLLLYARSLFDDLVANNEEMDVQAFVFFIQEILNECTLRGRSLRAGVCESLASRLGAKLVEDFSQRSIRWNDAESVLVSILNEVWSKPALFQD